MKRLQFTGLSALMVVMLGILAACDTGGAATGVPTVIPTVVPATTAPTAMVRATAVPTVMVANTPTTAMVANTPTAAMMGTTPTAGMMGTTPTAGMMGGTPTAGMMGMTPTAGMMGMTPTAGMMGTTPTAGTSGGTITGTGASSWTAMGATMKGVTSYHLSMTTDMGATGTVKAEIDMIPPDKMDMTSSTAIAGMAAVETRIIRIGEDTWTQVAGAWTKTTMAATNPTDVIGTMAQATVDDLGDTTLDGVAVHHVKVVSVSSDAAGSSMIEAWLAKDTNLLHQLQTSTDSAGTKVTVTMKYSRYNDPAIKIEAPQ